MEIFQLQNAATLLILKKYRIYSCGAGMLYYYATVKWIHVEQVVGSSKQGLFQKQQIVRLLRRQLMLAIQRIYNNKNCYVRYKYYKIFRISATCVHVEFHVFLKDKLCSLAVLLCAALRYCYVQLCGSVTFSLAALLRTALRHCYVQPCSTATCSLAALLRAALRYCYAYCARSSKVTRVLLQLNKVQDP